MIPSPENGEDRIKSLMELRRLCLRTKMRRGFQLCGMSEELTKAFERPLIFSLVVTFQGFVVGFFGFTTLFFRSELNSFLNYVSAPSFLFVSIGNMSRMLCYYLMGQKLVDAYDATQNELGRLKYEAAGFELEEEDFRIIAELMRRIEGSKTIRPLPRHIAFWDCNHRRSFCRL